MGNPSLISSFRRKDFKYDIWCKIFFLHIPFIITKKYLDSRLLGSVVWHTGLVALQHVESFQARDGTHVPWLAGRFLSTVPPGKPLSQFSDFIQWGRTSRIILSNSSDGKHPRFVPDINEIASRISPGSYLLIFYLELLELYSGFLYLFASEIGPYISFSCITVRFGISYPVFI